MQISGYYRCDRCGIKIEEAEFILKKNSHRVTASMYNDGYIIVGAYCKQCGYLINEAANISKVDKEESG